MFSLDAAQALSHYVGQEMEMFPQGWGRAAIYLEARRRPDGWLSGTSTRIVYVGEQGITDIDPHPRSSAAIQDFVERCERSGSTWSALRIAIEPDGRFKTKVYYDSWPSLDGDWRKVDARLLTEDAP